MKKTYTTFIEQNGKKLFITVYLKNIKHSYVKYRSDGIIISTNSGKNMSYMLTYIKNNFNKIYSKVHSEKVLNTNIFKSNSILFLGQLYTIENDENIELPILHDRIIKINPINKESSIKKFLISAIQVVIHEVETQYLTLLGIKNETITYSFKLMKTRYGSCNKQLKKININLLIAQYDIEFIKYILAHEYCHLIVSNHSTEFYNLLKVLIPNYKDIKK